MSHSTQVTSMGNPVSQETMVPGLGELAVVHEGNSTTFITQAQDEEQPPLLPIVLQEPLPPPMVFQPSQVLTVVIDVVPHHNK